MCLPISKTRSHCYDGAATMMGTYSQISTQLTYEGAIELFTCTVTNMAYGDTLISMGYYT